MRAYQPTCKILSVTPVCVRFGVVCGCGCTCNIPLSPLLPFVSSTCQGILEFRRIHPFLVVLIILACLAFWVCLSVCRLSISHSRSRALSVSHLYTGSRLSMMTSPRRSSSASSLTSNLISRSCQSRSFGSCCERGKIY